MQSFKARIIALTLWWLWLPAVLGIIWGIGNLFFGGFGVWLQSWDHTMMANFWSLGGFLWLLLAIWLLVSAAIWVAVGHDGENGPGVVLVALGLVVLTLLSSAQFVRVLWDNDKDFGGYYAKATVIYTPDLDTYPQSLKRLLDSARPGKDDRCDLVGTADVPSCIKQGTLPATGWDPRVGSLQGAVTALTRSADNVQKVSLDTDMMVYLNATDNRPARWSGVLDGEGITQSLGGVAEWSGSGNPTQCFFDGPYEIDRAFAGSRSNNLPNLLAEKFPHLRYETSDVWGHCDGKEPIVVVPVRKQVYYADRTVDVPGGIIIVQGDNGVTKLTHVGQVKPGQYPGPVYPMSLVERQRHETKWAAGRENWDRNGFGYDPATSQAQGGNVSEYLLRDKASGRLVYVSPLTLSSSSSEQFVAYSVSYADEVRTGQLNELRLYVLAEDDPRRINIDDLEADARNYLSTQVAGFISSGGRLVEFIPVNGDRWRAFGELNGRVIYRLDISANHTVPPTLVTLAEDASDGNGTPNAPVAPVNPGPASGSSCGQPVDKLSPADLTTCLKQFADELNKRVQAPPTT